MADQTQSGGQRELRIDDSKLGTSAYANTIRTTPLADAVVLDFGINMPSTSAQEQNVAVFEATNRIVMNWATAKRMVDSLSQAVERYERQFGEARPPQPIQ